MVGEEPRIACLRLPDFPLQQLFRRLPDWRGKSVAWLETLKPEAPLRYLSQEAQALGLRPGMRYATALGLVPDLRAQSCDLAELQRADRQLVKLLRKFSPVIFRGSGHLANGLYLLDIRGLSRAFSGMKRWATLLLAALEKQGWEGALALGYTPFACEMATYRLPSKAPLQIFEGRQEEECQTLRMPLSLFGLAPEQIRRLQRFGIITLEDFLALDGEEVRSRFGGDLLEFYGKAYDVLFTELVPVPEEEPLWEQRGFPDPTLDLSAILLAVKELLHRLITRLVRREEGVAEMRIWLLTEDEQRFQHRVKPSYPSADADWLERLVSLRLQHFFDQHPLRWGQRVERVVLVVVGEPDAQPQEELFSSWDQTAEAADPLVRRDRQAALCALAQLRAEYGESCLRQAVLADHALPGRDHGWGMVKETPVWFQAAPEVSSWKPDQRVRRQLKAPVWASKTDRWKDKHGPYQVDGGWWEQTPFRRSYYFVQENEQTGWLYRDEEQGGFFVQGWLQ